MTYTSTYGPLYGGGADMAIPAWSVLVDWNNDGDYADAGDNISGRTLDTATMTIQYGRDQARALAPAAPGTAAFLIDNVSRDYSPDNASSALAPNVLPARPVKISAVQTGLTLNANPAFEAGVTSWNAHNGAAITSSAAFAHGGAKSMLITPDGVTANPNAECEHEPVVPGVTYSASAWFRNGAVWAPGATANINWYDAANSYISTTLGTAVALPAAAFTQAAVSGTAPPAAAFGSMNAQVQGTPAAGNLFYVDDAALLGVPYTMFLGFFDTYDVSSQDHTVAVTCVDALARFSGVTLSTALYQGIRTGAAIGLILDAIGWPGGLRDLDTGSTQIRWWWEEDTDALTALQKLIVSEGPPAIAFVDAATGNFVFRDRQHRLIRAASATSQAAWADSGTDAVPVFTAPFTYDLGWSGIINSVTVSVDQRDPLGALAVVWQASSGGGTGAGAGEDIITIPAGGSSVLGARGRAAITATQSVIVSAGDPFTGAIPPVAGVDFTQISGTTTATLSRTSGQSCVITLTDSGGGSSVSGLQLRAYPVPVTATIQVTQSDATSVTANGTRSLPPSSAPAWAGVNDAAAIAAGILAQRKKRLPVVSVTFAGGGNTVLLTQQLARDLSDRVTITEFETGLANADFYIEQIAHAVSGGGAWLVTTFSCEKVPAGLVQPFIFDDAAWGKFDTGGVLGI